MMIDKTNKRLMSVKETYPLLFQKQCSCCGNNYIKEKMYKVHRWGVNKTVHRWDYCRNCMPKKEDVLNEIDTDACIFGIAFVDEQIISKTDYSKIKKLRDSIIKKR